ncbi:putative Ig domain-containing protein [Actinomadura yumaensis]|uniref:Ig domain-containing protein n=1 Tax=Actinomadura yumaensis TaxID=111807 RepID=A0ABW2CNT9_9ACTN
MTAPVYGRRRARGAEHPVELRFVDMLLIVIATLMFVAVVLSVTSAFSTQAEPRGGKPDAAPRVETRSAPAAVAGRPYELTLAVRGGDGTYAWRTLSGALPPGLALDRSGVVRGTPAGAVSTQATVQVTDGAGTSAQRDLAFTVRPAGEGAAKAPPPRVASDVSLLGARAGREYRHVFKGEGGTPPYTWKVAGEPPKGLGVAPDGTLTGRPKEAGTSTFTVTMADGAGASVRQQVRMDVKPQPESLFWRMLGWLKTVVTWMGYLLVLNVVYMVLFGAPPTAGHAGLFGRRRR